MRGSCRRFASVQAIGLASLAVLLHQGASSAEPPRYKPSPKTTLVYTVEITATMPSETERYVGTITYKVTSADELLQLKFQGGLGKRSQTKPTARLDSDGLPPMDFFRRGSGPFDSLAWRGLRESINHLTLTSQGAVREIEGDSQLPFLLGNLSMLVFEPLPDNDQQSWTATYGVSVHEHDSSPFSSMRPLLDSNQRKISSASETVQFSLEKQQGDLATYRKTYNFTMPGTTESSSIVGDGLWTFNRRLGVSESLDYTSTLTSKTDGITLTIPLSIKYRRISEEEWAKKVQMEKEFREKAEQEGEVETNNPLDDAERNKLLVDLKSRDLRRTIMALGRLNVTKPRHDPAIVNAVKRLLDHSNPLISQNARQVALRFSPDFEANQAINKKYSEFGMLFEEDLGPRVTPSTPLPKGLLVAYRNQFGWFAGTVVGATADDEVVVKGRMEFDGKTVCSRSDIRLAPPGVVQLGVDGDDAASAGSSAASGEVRPARQTPPERQVPPANDAAADRGFRVWTDSTGTFTVMAKYLGVDDGKVRLQRKQDNKEIRVPLDRLSEQDLEAVERLCEPPGKNPFEP